MCVDLDYPHPDTEDVAQHCKKTLHVSQFGMFLVLQSHQSKGITAKPVATSRRPIRPKSCIGTSIAVFAVRNSRA